VLLASVFVFTVWFSSYILQHLIFLACESDHKTTKKTKIFGGKNFDFFGFCNGHFFFQGGGVPDKKIFVVAENDIDKKLLTQLLDRSGSCDKNFFFNFVCLEVEQNNLVEGFANV